MAEGSEVVLIHVLHELFLYEVVKIAYWCSPPFSLVAQTEVQNTKVQDRVRCSWVWPQTAAGILEEGWKERKVVGCAILWYFYGIAMSDSASRKFQEFQRSHFKILLLQRNNISIKHISTSFIAECHLPKEGVGQILHDLSDWLHSIKSNYYISKNPRQAQPTWKHISVFLKNNQQIPRN